MAVLELKGKIAAVLPTETVGTNNLKKQVVMFNVPGYVDGFGDKKGKDELWALSVLGDKIDELSLNGSLCDRNAVVKCFINSKTYTRDKEPDMYFIEAVIAKITLMPEKMKVKPLSIEELETTLERIDQAETLDDLLIIATVFIAYFTDFKQRPDRPFFVPGTALQKTTLEHLFDYAIKTADTILRNDRELFLTYRDNISLSFQNAYSGLFDRDIDKADFETLAKEASDNFLKTLLRNDL